MNRADAEEYTQSIGQIVTGSWRQIALAERLGVPQALGMTLEQWVKERIGGYVRLAKQERFEAVLELKAEGYSNRQVAGVLGVDETTIRRDTAANAAPSPENPNLFNPSPWPTAANVAPPAGTSNGFSPPPPTSPWFSDLRPQTVFDVSAFLMHLMASRSMACLKARELLEQLEDERFTARLATENVPLIDAALEVVNIWQQLVTKLSVYDKNAKAKLSIVQE
jgi:hypothetical protein